MWSMDKEGENNLPCIAEPCGYGITFFLKLPNNKYIELRINKYPFGKGGIQGPVYEYTKVHENNAVTVIDEEFKAEIRNRDEKTIKSIRAGTYQTQANYLIKMPNDTFSETQPKYTKAKNFDSD